MSDRGGGGGVQDAERSARLNRAARDHALERVREIFWREDREVALFVYCQGAIDLQVIDEGSHGEVPIDLGKVVDIMRSMNVPLPGWVLVHTHPTTCEPSLEDYDVTLKVAWFSKVIGVPLLDHCIVGRDGVFSFADTDSRSMYLAPRVTIEPGASDPTGTSSIPEPDIVAPVCASCGAHFCDKHGPVLRRFYNIDGSARCNSCWDQNTAQTLRDAGDDAQWCDACNQGIAFSGDPLCLDCRPDA